MLKYKFVPHTADVRFLSYGRNFEELIANSMLAMFDTEASISAIAKDAEHKLVKTKILKIKESATSERDLLWYMLQKALSELDSIGAYGYSVEGVKVKSSGSSIEAYASIGYVDEKVKYSKIYVKGVSGYTLEVRHEKERYMASIVIDI
jgi:SHS2 domain-containing protein